MTDPLEEQIDDIFGVDDKSQPFKVGLFFPRNNNRFTWIDRKDWEELKTKLIDLVVGARKDEFLNTASMMDIPGAGVTPRSAGAMLKQRLETRHAQLNSQDKGDIS